MNDMNTQSEGASSLASVEEGGSELLVFNDDYHTLDRKSVV